MLNNIHVLLNKGLLSTYYALGTVLVLRMGRDRTRLLSPRGHALLGQMDTK